MSALVLNKPSGGSLTIQTEDSTAHDTVVFKGSAAMTNTTNDIINGQFRVAQAGTSFAAAASGVYDLDGWLLSMLSDSGSTVTVTQEGSARGTGNYARKVTVTSAEAAVAVGDLHSQETRIEGYDAVKYIGNTFTIGFWVTAPVTGIHCISVYDGTSSMVKEYTINAVDTWEFKQITIAGGVQAVNSTTNAWGFRIRFCNLAGTSFQSAADSWIAGFAHATSNQVNDFATNGNIFRLSGVTMNLGSTVAEDTATYEQDLARCQRYYQVIAPKGVTRVVATAYFPTATLVRGSFGSVRPMRTAPTPEYLLSDITVLYRSTARTVTTATFTVDAEGIMSMTASGVSGTNPLDAGCVIRNGGAQALALNARL